MLDKLTNPPSELMDQISLLVLVHH